MRIAVAGAGMQGSCIALELARRGHQVDLYDRESAALTQAATGNEGKIHLGFTYGMDRSHRTVKTMLTGALHFAGNLRRWLDTAADDLGISTPFYYGVHRGSQLSAQDVALHFARVQDTYSRMREATGLDYLGQSNPVIFEDVTRAADAQLFDMDRFHAIYRTAEMSINPDRVAAGLRRRLSEESGINLVTKTHVTAVNVDHRRYPRLQFTRDDQQLDERYDHVINATWSGLLELDRTVGVLPQQNWLLRNKLGILFRTDREIASIPSLTVVLGKYGDIVNYRDGTCYISWYPACMVGMVSDLRIPHWSSGLDDIRRADIVRGSLDALANLCPGVRNLEAGSGSALLKGGVIFAWGAQDIDHRTSKLHSRHEIGVSSHGNYHSVNTGKYTMAPYYAVELANRIGA